MHIPLSSLGVALAIVVSMASSLAASGEAPTDALDARQAQRIDQLFARWDSRETPGGVVAVIRDGQIVHEHAFGMASLDFDVPNTADTRFQIASLSKQFTAFSVLLLQQQGKISLDDDVRKYVPELPALAHVITLRHLLHHTSGLRDQPHLMWMAGWRFEDKLVLDDVMPMLARQRTGNFDPGADMMYCNSGYTLLGVVVERVSGQRLAAFDQERIFKPLGMTHTFVQEDDYGKPVKNGTTSYRPAKGGGYEGFYMWDSIVGQSGIVSNVADLALWDQNFYDAKVGGKDLIGQMLESGRRNDGSLTGYAGGVDVGEYRGVPVVEHSGSIAAYKCHFARFPEQRFSVIVLANADDVSATTMAHRVADICLEGTLKAVAPEPVAEAPPKSAVTLEPGLIEAYVGDYELAPGNYVTISRDGDHVYAQGTGSGQVELTPASQTSFRLPNLNVSVTFVRQEGAARATALRTSKDGKEREARRVEAPPVAGLVGDYYCAELGVIYQVKLKPDGTPQLFYPRGELRMTRTSPDSYDLPFPLRSVHFERDAGGAASGFVVECDRAGRLTFRRVALPTE